MLGKSKRGLSNGVLNCPQLPTKAVILRKKNPFRNIVLKQENLSKGFLQSEVSGEVSVLEGGSSG